MTVIIELSISENINSILIPSEDKLQYWANASYLGDKEVVVSMRVVNNEEMRVLNKNYRGMDKPTNVLSFPMELPEEIEVSILGDLALCHEVIEKEAEQQVKTVETHWVHMLVHGMLHLQGFDHIENDEAEVMEAKEITIMKELGFKNPYK